VLIAHLNNIAQNEHFWGFFHRTPNEQEMLMQAELYQGQEKQESTIAKKKKDIFEKVVTTVNACFNLEL
jgi:hypothetical protein